MKRVIIVHGWDGSPEEAWFPWLRGELESLGFTVNIPQLPHPDTPQIDLWVPALAEAVGAPDEDTFFIGHSMGCQTIARYLEGLPDDVRVGGSIFVAGFFTRLTGLDSEGEEIARPWFENPVNLERVRSRMKKSVAIFSDDDPYVPLDNITDFRERLSSEIILEHSCGHYNTSAGCLQLPTVVRELLKISQ